jgi:hypothetical protein
MTSMPGQIFETELTDFSDKTEAAGAGPVHEAVSTFATAKAPARTNTYAVETSITADLAQYRSKALATGAQPPAVRVPTSRTRTLQLEEERVRAVFTELDADGNGSLDPKEMRKLNKVLGNRMKAGSAHAAFEQMDRLNAGKVTFAQFKKWWFEPGRNRSGVQGAHLNPLGLFLRTSIPFIWCILSVFLPA